MTQPPRRKSRHFTVVARREIDRPPDELFTAWTTPNIRRAVVAPEGQGPRLTHFDLREGGEETFEASGRDRISTKITRRYTALRPPTLIIAQTVTELKSGANAPTVIIAAQELVLFKPLKANTEIVASTQVTAMRPTDIKAVEDDWNAIFDRFEDQLEPKPKHPTP